MKVCRYNWHSAGSLGWTFSMLKYKYIFQIKYTQAILSNSTGKLSLFEISKMRIAVLENKFIVLLIAVFGTLSFPIADTRSSDPGRMQGWVDLFWLDAWMHCSKRQCVVRTAFMQLASKCARRIQTVQCDQYNYNVVSRLRLCDRAYALQFTEDGRM